MIQSPKTLAGQFFEQTHELIQDNFLEKEYGKTYKTNGPGILNVVYEYGSVINPAYPDLSGHRDRINNICKQFGTLNNTGLGRLEDWKTVVQHLTEMQAIERAEEASLAQARRQYGEIFKTGRVVKVHTDLTDTVHDMLEVMGNRQRFVETNHIAATEVLASLRSITQLATDILEGL